MHQPAILCLASYEKGHDFLRECKHLGCRVLLVTSLSLRATARWPLESLDNIFYMPDRNKVWDHNHAVFAISHLARNEQIFRIVALDDLDLELAASLREHLRIPGMGESTTRYFRDKLAMRMKGLEAGLRVPPFVHLLNNEKVRQFVENVPAPWVLKPRSLAGAIGVKKVESATELEGLDQALGDRRSFYLLEKYIPGDVFHVDSIVYENQIRFAVASAYGRPPMDVTQGGIFTTSILDQNSSIARDLLEQNARVLPGMGLLRGVSHTEYIRSAEGEIYFLETSARVGGAHIAELVEAATGINLWAEWAKIEIAGGSASYSPPSARNDYAGLVVSLARQTNPDTSSYTYPEIVWRMDKPNHVGFIVASRSHDRIAQLLATLLSRIQEDFYASAPPRDTLSD